MTDSHKRTILFGFLDIHRRLAEMEAMLAGSLMASPLSQYVSDHHRQSGESLKIISTAFAA